MSDSAGFQLLGIETALGEGNVLLTSFSGVEGVSQLFHFDIELVSEDMAITPDKLLGTNATVWVNMDREAGQPVYFNGMVSHFVASETVGRYERAYRARLVPWLWFLTRSAELRIFQGKSVIDIVQQVFGELGYSAFSVECSGTYASYDYKVQYRETHFAFISRLLEHEGIFYFFRHENGKHTMVLADHPTSFTAGSVTELDWESRAVPNCIHGWQNEWEMRTGKVTLQDFNLVTPTTDLTVAEPTIVDIAMAKKFEAYDYPGAYETPSVGKALAKVRIEAEEAAYHVITGESLAPSIQAGTTFQLAKHPIDAENGIKVAALWVRHTAQNSGLAMSGSAQQTYSNSFVCAPASQVYHPPRTTPRPVVQGPQTAIVVGPAGEEIYTDLYGRIKVQFHWDREGQYNERSTFWVRLAQSWAGKQWGSMVIPRIGMEVLVAFLEGDPDRPVVVACLNNADSMPPESLPSKQTQSVFRTRSSKGGNGYSELTFEDLAGSEFVFLRSSKDQHSRIVHDTREWIGHDRHLMVQNDRLENVAGDFHLSITGDRNEKVGGTASLNVGSDIHQKAGQNFALKAGANLAIEAATMISLKVGGNFITIGPSGVNIVGTMVNVNSGGSAGSLTAQPKAPTSPAVAMDTEAGAAGGTYSAKNRSVSANTITWEKESRSDSTNQAAQAGAMQDASASGTPFVAVSNPN